MRFAASKVPPEDEPLSRIKAQRIDISNQAPRTDERGGGSNGELVLIDVNHITVIFLGASNPIDAPWAQLISFAPGALYIRTTTALYQPTRPFTRLASLKARLDPTQFLSGDRGVVVNFKRILVVEFKTKLKRVGFCVRTGNTTEIEYVHVSRRGAQEIRRRLV